MSSSRQFTKHLQILCAVFALALLNTACGLLDASPSERIARAQEYLSQGDLRSAQIELKNLLQDDPKSIQGRWLLGETYLDAGDYASAEKEFRRALVLGVGADSALVPIAESMLKQGKLREIVDEFGQTSGISVDSATSLRIITGLALLGLEEIDSADRLFDRVLAENPTNARAMFGKAAAAHARNLDSQSKEWIAQAIANDPNQHEAYSLWGIIERKEGNFEAAKAALLKALEINAINHINRIELAWIYVQIGELEKANQELLRVEQAGQFPSRTSHVRGVIALIQGDFSTAREQLDQTLNIEPGNNLARLHLAHATFRLGLSEQTNQLLNSYLATNPSSVAALKLQSQIWLQESRYQEASDTASRIHEQFPEDRQALSILVTANTKLGNTKAAIDYQQQLLELLDDPTSARGTLGMLLAKSGAADEGAKMLEELVASAPDSEKESIALVTIHLQSGERARAVAAAERFADAAPHNYNAANLYGLTLVFSGDIVAAETQFTKALAMKPGDPTAAANLAAIAINAKDFAKARDYYLEVLEQTPGHVGTLDSLAALELMEGHTDRAVAWLRQSIDRNPRALAPRFALARIHLKNGNPKQVIELLSGDIADQYADNPARLRILGQAQLESGKAYDAVSSFQSLARLIPESPEAHYLASRAYGETGAWAEAEAEINTALRIDPNYLPAHFSLIKLTANTKGDIAAKRLFTDLESQYPDSLEVLGLKGWLQAKSGDHAAAATTYQLAFERKPTSYTARSIAQELFLENQKNQALEVLERWLQENPQDASARYQLVQMYELAGIEDTRIMHLRQLLHDHPDNVLALNDAAWVLRKGSPGEALEYAERAYRLAPDAPAIMDTLAVILLSKGDTARALGLLEKASSLAPEANAIGYHLAIAQSELGQRSQAIQTLHQILSDQKPFEGRDEAEALLERIAR